MLSGFTPYSSTALLFFTLSRAIISAAKAENNLNSLGEHMEKEKKTKPKHNMWQNTRYMVKLAWKEKEKKVLFISLAIALLAVAIQLIKLYVTPSILSAVEEKLPLWQVFATIIAFVAASLICSALYAYAEENVLFGRITLRSLIINKINKKTTTTSYANLDDEQFNTLMKKAMNSTVSNDQATEAVWTTLTLILQNVLGFALYGSLIGSLQPLLLAAVLLTALIGYFVNYKANEYAYIHREEEGKQEKKIFYAQNTSKSPTAAKDIRIFGLRPWISEVYTKALSALSAFHGKVENRYMFPRLLNVLLTFIRNGAAYAYLIYLVINGNITIAEFLLYFTAIEGFSEWITGLLDNLNELHRQSLELSTVREFLEYPEPLKFEEGESLIPENIPYELKLENVSYKYAESDRYVLKNINLTLKAGERLAVVGLNGAGKTTLIKIMCGFYDPTEGRVLLNGKDIRDYNRRDYYKMFSAVFQTFNVLPGSVAANVAQTEDGIDTEKVKACIAQAGLTEKIESIPEKYETKLNREVYEDAANLSGGETQRLILARALYKDAPFIMLDEPTAALDPIAEADLYQKYGNMTKGKSSVYISHRLASTRFCDRTILIDGGVIAEEGTHESLLAAGGKYAELFNVQSKYYSDGEEGKNDEE